MRDEDAEQHDDREHGELDHALHELEREERQKNGDDDGEDRHFRRFVPPSLFCANITIPTQTARISATLMTLSSRPMSRMPMTTATMSPIIAPPPPALRLQSIARDNRSCARPSS